MADDISQDQTQTMDTNQSTIPQVESSPTQPTPENPVVSETPNTPNPEPVAPATSEPQQPEPQLTETKTETPPPVSPPVLDIHALHFPFAGNFPVTFSFGQQSNNEEIKKKFQEWGIIGHNGLDFGLSAGNEVFACDSGKVIQSGDNGDFGTSITIQHSWGQSLYGHLQETKVKEGDEIQVNKVIGLSGSSGAAFGEHLHFAIKPNNPNPNNGYLGFIDPSPYLSLPSQKEEPKQETPPVQPTPEKVKPPETTQPVPEPPKPEETEQTPVEVIPPPIKLDPEKPAEQPQQPEPPQNPKISDEEIQKQVNEKLKTELDSRRLKANQVRLQKKEDNLKKIFDLVQNKRVVSNDEVRDFLHVSQSTATNYLSEMVNRGMLKKEGERGGAKYSI